MPICTSLVTTITGASTETTLSVSKSILNVSLGLSPIAGPIPGSTVTYTINYSNAGNNDAVNMIIYDQLPANAIYLSTTPLAGWGAQYTYDDPPADQGWSSPDYSDVPPGVPENVR